MIGGGVQREPTGSSDMGLIGVPEVDDPRAIGEEDVAVARISLEKRSGAAGIVGGGEGVGARIGWFFSDSVSVGGVDDGVNVRSRAGQGRDIRNGINRDGGVACG